MPESRIFRPAGFGRPPAAAALFGVPVTPLEELFMTPPDRLSPHNCGRTAAVRGLAAPGGRTPRVIAVTSGKGGVGKTNIVANLSVSLAELDRKVIALDGDFGLANLDILFGIAPRYHLGHVLCGDRTMGDICVQGPAGVRIIPSGSGLQRMAELTRAQRSRLAGEFARIDADTDYVIIDTAAGISRNVIQFLLLAGEVIVVSTPEPAAIVDAYAVIKIVLAEAPDKNIQVVVNCAESASDAREVFGQIDSVVRRFLDRGIEYLGHIERDPRVPEAVRAQVPVAHRFPDSPAGRCFRLLAHRLTQREGEIRSSELLLWETLLNDWVN